MKERDDIRRVFIVGSLRAGIAMPFNGMMGGSHYQTVQNAVEKGAKKQRKRSGLQQIGVQPDPKIMVQHERKLLKILRDALSTTLYMTTIAAN